MIFAFCNIYYTQGTLPFQKSSQMNINTQNYLLLRFASIIPSKESSFTFLAYLHVKDAHNNSRLRITAAFYPSIAQLCISSFYLRYAQITINVTLQPFL